MSPSFQESRRPGGRKDIVVEGIAADIRQQGFDYMAEARMPAAGTEEGTGHTGGRFLSLPGRRPSRNWCKRFDRN